MHRLIHPVVLKYLGHVTVLLIYHASRDVWLMFKPLKSLEPRCDAARRIFSIQRRREASTSTRSRQAIVDRCLLQVRGICFIVSYRSLTYETDDYKPFMKSHYLPALTILFSLMTLTGCFDTTRAMWQSMPPAEEVETQHYKLKVHSLRQQEDELSIGIQNREGTPLFVHSHITGAPEFDHMSNLRFHYSPNEKNTDQPLPDQQGTVEISYRNEQRRFTFTGDAMVLKREPLVNKVSFHLADQHLFYSYKQVIHHSLTKRSLHGAVRVVATPLTVGIDTAKNTLAALLIPPVIVVLAMGGYGSW